MTLSSFAFNPPAMFHPIVCKFEKGWRLLPLLFFRNYVNIHCALPRLYSQPSNCSLSSEQPYPFEPSRWGSLNVNSIVLFGTTIICSALISNQLSDEHMRRSETPLWQNLTLEYTNLVHALYSNARCRWPRCSKYAPKKKKKSIITMQWMRIL